MPNWTSNQLIIEGDKNQMKAVLDFIKGENGVIDFNKIIPMPEILRNTVSGACTIDGQQVNSWYEDTSIANWEERSKTQRLFTDEENAELEKVGYTSWYDWCCDKWGTKWNACDPDIEAEYDDWVEIRFDTAWSPPAPVVEVLRARFPNLDVRLHYRNEDDPEFPHSL